MLPKALLSPLAQDRSLQARIKHAIANVTMSDRQILTNAFDLLNIGYVETYQDTLDGRFTTLVLKEGMENIEGYGGFWSEYVFDSHGTFLTSGAYGV